LHTVLGKPSGRHAISTVNLWATLAYIYLIAHSPEETSQACECCGRAWPCLRFKVGLRLQARAVVA
jgi:hypothetical protein